MEQTELDAILAEHAMWASGKGDKRANLEGAYLKRLNLKGAYLRGAYLFGANLVGIKNYSESHEIFAEVVRQQKVALFTESEWAIIGQVVLYRLCWQTISQRYGPAMLPIFAKLATAGFGEWETRYKAIRVELDTRPQPK